MAGPFPGMDPYLEHPSLWPDVHLELIAVVRRQLRPKVGPRYYVAADERVYSDGCVELREHFLELRDLHRGHAVVTVLEVLSPANKRPGAGREEYLRKQADVLASAAHLLEVDLLRAGEPTVALPSGWSSRAPYRAVVSRASRREAREVYAVDLRDRLPRVDVPLADLDPNVVLDLPSALAEAYAGGAYDRRVDYDAVPVTPLAAEDAEWARERVRAWRAQG